MVSLQASPSSNRLAGGVESLQRGVVPSPTSEMLTACKLLGAPPPILRRKLCYHAKLGRRGKLPFTKEALAGLEPQGGIKEVKL